MLTDDDIAKIAKAVADEMEERKESARVDEARSRSKCNNSIGHAYFETGHGRRCIDCGKWAG